MPEAREQRRLAAILAADVVGYSRLMEADESGTLTRLRMLRRDIIDPSIAAHSGRMVKLMGDGALVEFASVVDAVNCAAAIQKGVVERQADLPEDQRIALVSITTDPERDTPEVLKGYAEAFEANLAGWSFLTGERATVLEVAHRYGVAVVKGAEGQVDHTLLTTLIDRQGTLGGNQIMVSALSAPRTPVQVLDPH